jgi:hypothetical protein
VAIGGRRPNTTDAIYKGLAISANPDRLYAAEFHNGRVDVFDGSFSPIHNPGQFTDPNLPAGFAPFGSSTSDLRFSPANRRRKTDACPYDPVRGCGTRCH